ncbi:polyphosphate kinase 2 [Zhongshania sp.]|uniref:polyphosphate kinase 2 n=1 Tax=Zhongshania sp. TaxID=1971902 RepID=UPI001B40C2A2|nr:polyphosphate kinase 2 [Zhongshania sp.]MBQ0796891.1 polyphosphate kinase 2 [Zhongshania sp.]
MKQYKDTLRALQIELVKLQRHSIASNNRIMVIIEGRDAAGKDGVIKRIAEHLSPRETRVVALGKPTARDEASWYFQRYVPYLPAFGEFVIFNRSWYNRAGVERVMGFCSEAEYQLFFRMVAPFEHMLIDSGTQLRKYFLDIDKEEQQARLLAREQDPLSNWKISPIDREAQSNWGLYSQARNDMLRRSHNDISPWMIVRANNKKAARINLIKDLLSSLDYADKDEKLLHADSNLIQRYNEDMLESGFLVN